VKHTETVTSYKNTEMPADFQQVIFLFEMGIVIPSFTLLLIQLLVILIVGFLFQVVETPFETATYFSSLLFTAVISELDLKNSEDYNMKNLPFTPAILNDANGDVTKRWSITFWCWSVQAGAKIRKFDYSVNKYKTERERRGYAKRRIELINGLLEKGYHHDSTKKKPGSILTINEALKHALEVCSVSHASQLSYNSTVSMFLSWCEARNMLKQPIEMFQKKDAFAYRDRLKEANKAGKTINTDVACMKRMWNLLKKRELVKDNPWTILEKEREIITNRNIAFTWGEVTKLSAAIPDKDKELWQFVSLMYHSLARPNELRQLQVYNIHLNKRKIYLDAWKTKNKKERWINIHDGLIDTLIDLIKNKVSKDYLFPGENGNPISKNRMTDRHRVFLKDLEMNDGDHTLYSWKHTGVIQAYEAGVDIKSIQLQCGHSSVAETDNYLKSLGLYNNQDIILRQPALPVKCCVFV
jgi:site-specific recombinase XerD